MHPIDSWFTQPFIRANPCDRNIIERHFHRCSIDATHVPNALFIPNSLEGQVIMDTCQCPLNRSILGKEVENIYPYILSFRNNARAILEILYGDPREFKCEGQTKDPRPYDFVKDTDAEMHWPSFKSLSLMLKECQATLYTS